MLRNGGQTLVQEMFETAVIRAHKELRRPQIWPPVSHGLHEANKLAFVGCELGVLWGDRPTEEGDRALTLVQHGAKTRSGRVAVDNEHLGEVGQLEHRG